MVTKKKFRTEWRAKNEPLIDVPSTSAPPPPPWIELPRDVTANILHRLGSVEILTSAQKVCTTWRSVCRDPSMWRVIDMENADNVNGERYKLFYMCLDAIELSQGQLIDINIEYFGCSTLIRHISGQCRQLKRLRLAWCKYISAEALCEAIENFPQLEELDLYFMKSISAGDIAVIGGMCPMLKSFKFDDRQERFSPIMNNNAIANAVAKSMPNLRHLQLLGNKMTNDGLRAILDNCTHLVSLDIRQCYNVRFFGGLDTKCYQQIEDVRDPDDSTSDYEWDGAFYDSDLIISDYDSDMDGDDTYCDDTDEDDTYYDKYDTDEDDTNTHDSDSDLDDE